MLEIVAWLKPVFAESSEREIWLSRRRIVWRTSNRLIFRMMEGPFASCTTGVVAQVGRSGQRGKCGEKAGSGSALSLTLDGVPRTLSFPQAPNPKNLNLK